MPTSPSPSPFTDFKESVRAASTGDITLDNLPATIDGVAMSYGDRFLAKDQDDAVENGIYVYLGEDEASEVTTGGRDGQLTSGGLIVVEEGTTHADTLWILTTDDPIEVGETELAFEEVGEDAPPAVDLLPLNNTWTGTNDFQDVVTFDGAAGFNVGGVPVTTFAGIFIDVGNNGFRLTGSNAGFTIAGSGEFTHVGDPAEAQIFQTKRSSSGPTEFYLYNTGKMQWGDGVSAPDTQLTREDADVLRLSGTLRTSVGPSTGEDLTNKDYVDGVAAPQNPLIAVAETIFQTAVATNVFTDVFDMDISVTGDNTNRIWLDFHAGDLSVIAGASNPTTIQLWDDTASVALTHSYYTNPAATALIQHANIRYLMPPFSGTKVFKIRMKRDGAGTTTLNGNGASPRNMYLTATWAENV